jgi:hypothetical protein
VCALIVLIHVLLDSLDVMNMNVRRAEMSKTQAGSSQLTAQQAIMISVLLAPAQTAELLHTTPGVLAVWRSKKRYALRFVKVGRKIFYRAEDIQNFIEARTHAGIVEPQELHQRRRAGRAGARANQ